MINLEVEITGPGLVINYPSELIIKALTDAGFNVNIVNKHRVDDPEKLLDTNKDTNKDLTVTVISNHQPWGG